MYCTYDDLVRRIGEPLLLQQIDLTAKPTEVSNPIDTAIADACAEIDGYLSQRYTLPLVREAPAMLRKLACDISIYNVFSRKGISLDGESDDAIVAKRYNDAIAFLKLVAAERADIVDDSGALVPANRTTDGGLVGIELFRA